MTYRLLLDTSSLMYRAFFALPASIKDDDGRPVNAVHGYLDMTTRLLTTRRPDSIVHVYDDVYVPEDRARAYPPYKAHRPPDPEGLPEQFGLLEMVLAAFGAERAALPTGKPTTPSGRSVPRLGPTISLKSSLATATCSNWCATTRRQFASCSPCAASPIWVSSTRPPFRRSTAYRPHVMSISPPCAAIRRTACRRRWHRREDGVQTDRDIPEPGRTRRGHRRPASATGHESPSFGRLSPCHARGRASAHRR